MATVETAGLHILDVATVVLSVLILTLGTASILAFVLLSRRSSSAPAGVEKVSAETAAVSTASTVTKHRHNRPANAFQASTKVVNVAER